MSRIIDLGKVMATPAGEWRVDASYEFLSVVSHNGSGYISKVDNTGVEPGTNDNVWMLLVSAGESPVITRDAKGNIYVNGELLTSAFADAEAAARRIAETDTSVRAAEQGRVNAENARVTAERLRVEAENLRQQSENGRKSNESARSNAEANRKTYETGRQFNETNRMNAETQRVGAENTRMSNESSRILQFNELKRRAEEAIEEAQAAARTVKVKGNGDYKVVIGRAIPAATWVPGVDYFNSEGLFKFRIAANLRYGQGTPPRLIAEFVDPIPAPISQFLAINVNDVATDKGRIGILGDELFIDETGRAVGFSVYNLGDIIDSEEEGPTWFVFYTNYLEYANAVRYNGVSVKEFKITAAKGTSPYLEVANGAVFCTKPPLLSTSSLRNPYTSSATFELPKNGVLIRRIKRRKVQRDGENTVVSRKVKYMKRTVAESLKRKHAYHIRIFGLCRHWRSFVSVDIDLRRCSPYTPE